MGLTPVQQSACAALNDVLHPSRGGQRSGSESSNLGQEQDWYNCLEVAGDVLEDCDDEEYEDGEFSSTDEPAATVQRQIADNPIQARILDLLISLYTHLPTGRDDKFFSPIIRFAVLSSLQRTGQWLPPRRITRILAVLLFCGREVLMTLMHQRLLQDPTTRYSQCVVHTNAMVCILSS
jgi:hypothetical protein